MSWWDNDFFRGFGGDPDQGDEDGPESACSNVEIPSYLKPYLSKPGPLATIGSPQSRLGGFEATDASLYPSGSLSGKLASQELLAEKIEIDRSTEVAETHWSADYSAGSMTSRLSCRTKTEIIHEHIVIDRRYQRTTYY